MLINQFLKYRHIANGITLDQQDDTLFLLKNGKTIATFTTHTTPEIILVEADKILNEGIE
jgi:urocanate hydratase